MTASHPAWILANLVSAKPKAMIKDLWLPFFSVKDGVTSYLASAQGADSEINIERYVRAAQSVAQCDYIKVGTGLHLKDQSWDSGVLYFPTIALRADFDAGGHAASQFFGMLNQYMPHSKIYFYKAGTHIQAYMNKLVEPTDYNYWMHIVNKCEELGVLHPEWVSGGSQTTGCRWSRGEGYPPPTLYKWHQL